MRKHDRNARVATGARREDGAAEFARGPSHMEAARRIDEIIARIPREFAQVEVLKANVHRERGVYTIALSVDRDGGVDTVLCERISRFIANRLEESLPPFGNYSLEVASAGLDRPLLTPAHFERFVGRDARIITSLRIVNRVEFSGTIEAADSVKATLADRYAGRVEIPYAAIKRANLVYEASADLKKKP